MASSGNQHCPLYWHTFVPYGVIYNIELYILNNEFRCQRIIKPGKTHKKLVKFVT